MNDTAQSTYLSVSDIRRLAVNLLLAELSDTDTLRPKTQEALRKARVALDALETRLVYEEPA